METYLLPHLPSASTETSALWCVFLLHFLPPVIHLSFIFFSHLHPKGSILSRWRWWKSIIMYLCSPKEWVELLKTAAAPSCLNSRGVFYGEEYFINNRENTSLIAITVIHFCVVDTTPAFSVGEEQRCDITSRWKKTLKTPADFFKKIFNQCILLQCQQDMWSRHILHLYHEFQVHN